MHLWDVLPAFKVPCATDKMTQWEVYQALKACKQPATVKDVEAKLGTPRTQLGYLFRRLVKNDLVKVEYKGRTAYYTIIAPFPERNVIC